MRPSVRGVAVTVVVLLILAQLWPVTRTNPPVTGALAPPPEIAAILRRACDDCHSHATVWPWYSRVAPVSWLVAHDVRHGRAELDVSTWTAYAPAKQAKKLRQIVEEVREGEMPPWYYVLMHADAKLSPADVDALAAWVDAALPPRAR